MSDFFDLQSKLFLQLIDQMAAETDESASEILTAPGLRDRIIAQSDGVIVSEKPSPYGVSKVVFGSQKYSFAKVASTSQRTFAAIVSGAVVLARERN